MPKIPKLAGRRVAPIATATVLWDVWRRIPPKQRKLIVAQARKHGPRLVKQAVKARKKSRRRF
jgi:hypothetical protein